ncbi:(+)-piperitol/(+)-sesamin synthase CYP81Q1-like protein [Drosera capensis]
MVPLLVPYFSNDDSLTMRVANVWALYRSPGVWKDPLEFKPERFMEVEDENDTFRFMPFGVGRRACPGANLGMRMVSLTLARLIQCFDGENCDGRLVDSDEGAGLTLPKSKPLEARCAPRASMSGVLLEL